VRLERSEGLSRPVRRQNMPDGSLTSGPLPDNVHAYIFWIRTCVCGPDSPVHLVSPQAASTGNGRQRGERVPHASGRGPACGRFDPESGPVGTPVSLPRGARARLRVAGRRGAGEQAEAVTDRVHARGGGRKKGTQLFSGDLGKAGMLGSVSFTQMHASPCRWGSYWHRQNDPASILPW
jgi:hypothetical protein